MLPNIDTSTLALVRVKMLIRTLRLKSAIAIAFILGPELELANLHHLSSPISSRLHLQIQREPLIHARATRKSVSHLSFSVLQIESP